MMTEGSDGRGGDRMNQECPEWCVLDHDIELAFGAAPVHEALVGTLPSGALARSIPTAHEQPSLAAMIWH